MALQYSYGIKNRYRPTGLVKNAYGWGNGPQYNQADVPNMLSGGPGSAGLTSDQFMQQFAYEWFQSGALGNNNALSNPPFLSGASGRLMPSLTDSTGAPARILRGYIRRAEREVGKQLDLARLYFMYNPETIQRDYVSYLDSTSLDPFNTVFQSKNDVAPPSFMDFSFSLFFDRQEEATQKDHPGVYVDYQFFDLVVRNVTPDDPLQTNATIPDNGVMMVNPRDISVIFSPQLMVQGRPLNANVSFEKFTHRMTPTRMTIRLTMRVIYIGPTKDQVEYVAEQQQSEAAIPFDEDKITLGDVWGGAAGDSSGDSGLDGKNSSPGSGVGSGGGGGSSGDWSLDQTPGVAFTGTGQEWANMKIRNDALNWAINHTVGGHGGGLSEGGGNWTDYNANGAKRYNWAGGNSKIKSCDCSGLVTMAYLQSGTGGKSMHWEDHPDCATIKRRALSYPKLQLYMPLSKWAWQDNLMRGDLLLRTDIPNKGAHIAFFTGYSGNKDKPDIGVFEAASSNANPEVGPRTISNSRVLESFDHVLRPTIVT